MASKASKLKAFQRKVGLPTTGHYDPSTRQEIRRARTGKPSETPKAKAVRRKAKLNDPGQVTQPLTPKALQAEVSSGVAQKYGLSERSLQDEQRVQNTQPSRIDSAYQAYVQALQDSNARTQAAYGQLAQNVQGMIGADQPTGGSEDAQTAAASRRALLQSRLAGVGTDQAAAGQSGGQLVAAGQLGRARSQESQRNVSANLAAKLRELEQEKGDYANTLTRDARTAERNYQLQQETLGLNTTKAANDLTAKEAQAAAARDARNTANSLSADRLREEIRSHKTNEGIAQQRADQANKPKKPKGHKGATHTQKVNASNQLETARNLISTKRKAGDRSSRTTYYNALVNEKHVPPDLARAAVEMEFDGGVNNALRSQLYRRYRIKLPHVNATTRATVTGTRTASGIAGALGALKGP